MPILTIIIILLINIIGNRQELKKLDTAEANGKPYSNTQENDETTTKDSNEPEDTKEKIQNWKIEIPSILLIANISEGTDEEILNEYVGHFSSTPRTEGNVGLAAHNRGYPINYFANLKELEGGEEIIYTYGEFTKTYVVVKNIKISDIDWSYLENSNENKITLITCIENEPAYRRCVQAIEKEEN